jgi:DNA-binding MarR family transcriptional regulator
MTSFKTNLIKEVFDLSRYISSAQTKSRLTMIQIRTLIFVYENEIVKPTEIAKKFAITPASVTSQIDKLVRDGWLKRVYNQDDKRVIEVKLTERAKIELPGEIKELHKSCEWIFNALSSEDQKELLSLVKKVNKSARI